MLNSRAIVHHVYPTACKTLPLPPGLGDFLRGSIAIAHHALDLGFDLKIDFSRHPIHAYLDPAHRCDADTDPLPGFDEYFDAQATLIYERLDALQAGARIALCTNLMPHRSRITPAVCRLVASQFVLGADVRDASAALQRSISDQPYAALHIRVVDDDLHARRALTPDLCRAVEEQVLTLWGKRVAVLSNNRALKEALCRRYDLALIDTQAVHLGKAAESSGVRDTLLDFDLLASAGAVYSHSDYGWSSGFSTWAATLSGAPFARLVLPAHRVLPTWVPRVVKGVRRALGV